MAFLDRTKFPGLAATVYLTLVALCLHGALTAPSWAGGAFDYELALIILTTPLFLILGSLFNPNELVSVCVSVIISAAVNAYVIHRVSKNIVGLD